MHQILSSMNRGKRKNPQAGLLDEPRLPGLQHEQSTFKSKVGRYDSQCYRLQENHFS